MYALTWIASSMLKYDGEDASRSFFPEIAWNTTGKSGVASCGERKNELIVEGAPHTSSSPS